MQITDRQRKLWTTTRSVVAKLVDDRCTTMASALAFSSMLSIVPFLAIVFAILKAFDVHMALAPQLLSSLTAGSQEIAARIIRYINNTKVGSVGAIGLLTLFMSVMATLDTVEEAFNQICGIERGKSVHHKLRDYLIVIFGIPLLIGLAVIVTTSLQHQGAVSWFLRLFGGGKLLLLRAIPVLSIWIALVCLYQFIPNVRIRLRHSLTGGLIAGVCWQIAQWAFIHFQLGVSRHNAIYGTLALLPVFMIWIYTSWIIVLAGMELIWHLQSRDQAASATKASQPGQPQDHPPRD